MRITPALIIIAAVVAPLEAAPNKDIEKTLLSYIPASKDTSYSSLRINDRTKRLLENCSISKVNFNINENRPSISTFKTKCQDGREVSFSAKLDGRTKSLVAKRSIKRKTRLNRSNFDIDWVPVDEINGITFKDLVKDNYYQTSRNLTKGQPISLKNVDVAPVIERGWHIKAKAILSNIAISIDVVALEDGAIGETIKVENTTSEKTFYAKVLNSSTVIINEHKI
ncbi:flagellar basal body P-ring formation chaperone FlgA [Vibrio parahaemolyticus]|uniref:Flagella basal body P-ring formation protein FlgA n=1 Tax=Vibrio parahaemolyticus TaxID=670 RepID=A0AAW8PXV1_VIBPH|nr:flagellar basal body P-ring formation chaperone FlgA [Vibrio parahaemolyticus]EGR2229442.1 flagella basal body P-ring formation protein FlgA [Vibrio parahaemolyticus]MDS1820839.1 flagellar basal body P-ring formation chaperone FlgA [Vibrio parahaemolyticus]